MIGWKEEVYGDVLAADLAALISVNAIMLGTGQGVSEAVDQYQWGGGKAI